MQIDIMQREQTVNQMMNPFPKGGHSATLTYHLDKYKVKTIQKLTPTQAAQRATSEVPRRWYCFDKTFQFTIHVGTAK